MINEILNDAGDVAVDAASAGSVGSEEGAAAASLSRGRLAALHHGVLHGMPGEIRYLH